MEKNLNNITELSHSEQIFPFPCHNSQNNVGRGEDGKEVEGELCRDSQVSLQNI